MEFWDQIGNFAALFPGAAPLAVDFALNGAHPDVSGYGLAYGLQSSQTPINVYPPEEMSFADLAEG